MVEPCLYDNFLVNLKYQKVFFSN